MSLSPTDAISKLTVDEPANGLAADDVSDPPAPKPARTVCGICNKEDSKYKCPHCPLAYCSVVCSRAHKDAHPPSSLPPKPPRPASLPLSAPPSGPPHPFSVLDDSPELRSLFVKYPTLPAYLERIYEATLPPPGSTGGGGSGLPWTLADVDPGLLDGTGVRRKKPEIWSKDVGLSRGRAALRKARMDPSEDGDGVREYCELVIHLLSRTSGSDEATSMVAREYNRDEMQFIESLHKQEHDD